MVVPPPPPPGEVVVVVPPPSGGRGGRVVGDPVPVFGREHISSGPSRHRRSGGGQVGPTEPSVAVLAG